MNQSSIIKHQTSSIDQPVLVWSANGIINIK
jgi:hypothetical protein